MTLRSASTGSTPYSFLPGRCFHRVRAAPLSISMKRWILMMLIVVLNLMVRGSKAQIVSVFGPVIDEETCYDHLRQADENADLSIQKTEFVTFLNLQSDFMFADTDYRYLPSMLTELYESLRSISPEGRISVAGTLPDEEPTDKQSIFLFQVCSQTYKTLQKLKTNNPTDAPSTLAPTPTTSPPTPVVTASPNGPTTPRPQVEDEDVFSGDVELSFNFTLGNDGGFDANLIEEETGNTIKRDMIESINILTNQIVETSFRRRGLSSARTSTHRVLLVDSVSEPTLDVIEDRKCPDFVWDFPPGKDMSCVDIRSMGTLIVELDDKQIIKQKFLDALDTAIRKGVLEKIAASRNSQIIYVNVKQPVPPPVPVESGVMVLGPPELVGIGVAGFLVGFALIGAMFLHGRKRRRFLTERKLEDDLDLGGDLEEAEMEMSVNRKKIMRNLGATYPRKSLRHNLSHDSSSSSINGGGSHTKSNRSHSHVSDQRSVASSSQAGSSGWSSGGVSSLNTSSVDSYENDPFRGSTLAAIGIASGITNTLAPAHDMRFVPAFNRRSDTDTISTNSDQLLNSNSNGLKNEVTMESGIPNLPPVTRNDLDAAIQAGDWAAVGATAALLANAASDTVSLSTKSYNSMKSSDSRTHNSRSSRNTGSSSASVSGNSLEAARAAELDHLVDTGDWEGVVLAAYKFDAAASERESSYSGRTSSSHGGSGSGSGSKHGGSGGNPNHSFHSLGTDRSSSHGSSSYSRHGGFSMHSPGASGIASNSVSGVSSTATSTRLSSSAASNARDILLRAEVEALVRKVVPDEIDNVDEMMTQFHGREEELLETLRTMQERSIAQRARAAVQRNAKNMARSQVRGGQQPLAPSPQPSAILPPRGPHNNNTRSSLFGRGRGGANTQKSIPQHNTAGPSLNSAGTQAPSGRMPVEYVAQNRISNVSTLTSSHPSSYSSGHPSSRQLMGNSARQLSPTALDEPPHEDPSFRDSFTQQFNDANGGKGKQTLTSHTNTSTTALRSNRNNNNKNRMFQPSQQQDTPLVRISKRQTALDLAIDSGDWEAVGEAAAMLSDTDGSSTASGFGGDASSVSTGGFSSANSSTYSLQSNLRATQELDDLIDVGNWEGVVEAASRFGKATGNTPSNSNTTLTSTSGKSTDSNASSPLTKTTSTGVSPRRTFPRQEAQNSEEAQAKQRGAPQSRPQSSLNTGSLPRQPRNNPSANESRSIRKQRSEEEEALAQADLWMAIAAQSKRGGTEPKGASDAADWAISRSVTALRQSAEATEKSVSSPKGSANSSGTSSSNKGSV